MTADTIVTNSTAAYVAEITRLLAAMCRVEGLLSLAESLQITSDKAGEIALSDDLGSEPFEVH